MKDTPKIEQPPQKGSIGRPQTNIDWDRVDELLVCGCSGNEIAANLGIRPGNLYDRCATDFNISFSEYSLRKREKGNTLLREAQFKKAIGYTDKGDNTLLIWLGKTRLEQQEKSLISGSLNVNIVDYSQSCAPSQIQTEGISAGCSESDGQGDQASSTCMGEGSGERPHEHELPD